MVAILPGGAPSILSLIVLAILFLQKRHFYPWKAQYRPDSDIKSRDYLFNFNNFAWRPQFTNFQTDPNFQIRKKTVYDFKYVHND